MVGETVGVGSFFIFQNACRAYIVFTINVLNLSQPQCARLQVFCGGGGGCCWVGTGPLGAPSARASGDIDGWAPALPHLGVGSKDCSLLTPGVSDFCGLDLSPKD